MNASETDPAASGLVSSDDELVFGPFRLFPTRRLLLEGQTPVVLGARALDVLIVLADRAGKMVGKDELIACVWPGVFVDEGNLRVHIASLRKALGDGHAGRRLIMTSPGRGYSFVERVVRLPASPPEPRPMAPVTGNLPSRPRQIVGRDETAALLTAQLPRCRFMTIVGPGGIGKTTVALSVAADLRSTYADGVWLIDLAPTLDPGLMPSVLASVLGIPVSSRDPAPALIDFLRCKKMLLIFDNCEHVIDVAAAVAEEIIKSAPDVHILATSREAFRVAGETVWRLPPLEAPPDSVGLTAKEALAFSAVQLFVQRVSAMSASFNLSDADAPAVGEICRRLDGLALAIELAAARVDSLGVLGVMARLDDRFRLLTRGYRTALPRHQTLRGTFEWSYELLRESTRVVLRRLALLAGDFALDAAGAIASDADINEIEIEDEIGNLVATSLLSISETGTAVRYRLLDSTRAYAHERLVQSGELAKCSRKHAEYTLRVLQAAGQDLTSWSTAEWLKHYGYQIDNVRNSLDWAFSSGGDPGLGIELTISAAPLWSLMSLNEECSTRVEAALTHLHADEHASEGRAMQLWAELGGAHAFTIRPGPEASRAWIKTLEIARNLSDVEYQLRALKGLWSSAFNACDLSSATAHGEEFSRVAEESNDPAYVQLSGRMLAMTEFYLGKFEAARVRAVRALDRYQNVDIQRDLLRFQCDQRMVLAVNLSKTLWLQGWPDQAVRMAQASLDYAREADHDLSVTYALAYAVIRLAIQTGDFEAARLNLDLLSRYVSSHATGQWTLFCHCWQGSLLCRQGDVVAGADILARTLSQIPEHSFRMHYTRFLGEFAHATAVAGEVDAGLKAINKALLICEQLDERWIFAELLRVKGEIVLLKGDNEAASVAEGCFRKSLDWSRLQGALTWELRSATSLAKLHLAQTRIGDAYTGLAEVYGRFTEGFGTYDLMAAKSLLNSIERDSRPS